MTQSRLKRFIRQAERLSNRQMTRRSLHILRVIALYRFVPTSFILELVSGDKRTSAGHLQVLFHRGLVERIQMERNSEFVYFITRHATIQLLIEEGLLTADDVDEEAIRTNREKDYSNTEDPGKRMFLKHELAISRTRLMLERACQKSEGRLELARFWQGSRLHQRVAVSKVVRQEGRIYETSATEYLPHRPDAFFSLRINDRPDDDQLLHFFYEADRKTTALSRFREKLRAHFAYVVKLRLQEKHYQVRRIRAVLVETLDPSWASQLRSVATDPIVSGPRVSPLFWFTPASLYTKLTETGRPLFLSRPEIIFDPIWATAVDTELRSLLEK